MLTPRPQLRGERRIKENIPGGKMWRTERKSTAFNRCFQLPENASPDGITASMDMGVLVLNIVKKPEAPKVGPPAPRAAQRRQLGASASSAGQ